MRHKMVVVVLGYALVKTLGWEATLKDSTSDYYLRQVRLCLFQQIMLDLSNIIMEEDICIVSQYFCFVYLCFNNCHSRIICLFVLFLFNGTTYSYDLLFQATQLMSLLCSLLNVFVFFPFFYIRVSRWFLFSSFIEANWLLLK